MGRKFDSMMHSRSVKTASRIEKKKKRRRKKKKKKDIDVNSMCIYIKYILLIRV